MTIIRKIRGIIRDYLPVFLPIPYACRRQMHFMWLPKTHWYGYLRDKYEPTTFAEFRKIIDSNRIDVFYDIGANAGMYSVAAAKSGVRSIESFEPSETHFKVLDQNTDHFSGVKTHKIALGEFPSQGTLVLTDEPGSHYVDSSINSAEIGQEINIYTLDLFRFEDSSGQKRRKVDLLKIDVEGYELNVLKGAKRLLLEDKPDIIIELDEGHLRRARHSRSEVIEFLRGLNYECVRVIDSENFLARPSLKI